MYYYSHDYLASGISAVSLGEYAEAEKAYAAYVREHYLAVPDSTRQYMDKIIAEQRFDRNDPGILASVAEYIQGAAEYDLQYDTALDGEEDVAVASCAIIRGGSAAITRARRLSCFALSASPRAIPSGMRGKPPRASGRIFRRKTPTPGRRLMSTGSAGSMWKSRAAALPRGRGSPAAVLAAREENRAIRVKIRAIRAAARAVRAAALR